MTAVEMSPECQLFSRTWSSRLVAAWNGYPEHHERLAGAGTVIFRVEAEGSARREVALCWDETGRMHLIAVPAQADTSESSEIPDHSASPCGRSAGSPQFSGGEEDWYAFVQGSYSAVAGVLSGRLLYVGPFSFALRFGASFDLVARVARGLTAADHPA